MKTLKRLSAVVVLTFALGVAAFAGDVQAPPCTDPGQISTPPCAVSQMATPGDIGTPTLASTAPGQTETPPSSNISLGEIAVSVLWNLLPLF